ncbi:MAG: hypothetical protein GXO63_02035, partial [Candidatus Micrarchaeota archaeon]|nr:hypothetical protein [Candidatus Micrarchaeota archaeon]
MFEEIDGLYRKYVDLNERLLPVLPRYSRFGFGKITELGNSIVKKAGELQESVSKNSFEFLLLENLKERILTRLKMLDDFERGRVDYFTLLSHYGVGEEIFDEIRKFAEGFDFQEVLKERFLLKPVLITGIESESEEKLARETVIELLERIYQAFFTGLFDSFEEYLKTVDFSRSAGSFHITGNVRISFSDIKFYEFFEDKRCIR